MPNPYQNWTPPLHACPVASAAQAAWISHWKSRNRYCQLFASDFIKLILKFIRCYKCDIKNANMYLCWHCKVYTFKVWSWNIVHVKYYFNYLYIYLLMFIEVTNVMVLQKRNILYINNKQFRNKKATSKPSSFCLSFYIEHWG